jgi:hypothetical protein
MHHAHASWSPENTNWSWCARMELAHGERESVPRRYIHRLLMLTIIDLGGLGNLDWELEGGEGGRGELGWGVIEVLF